MSRLHDLMPEAREMWPILDFRDSWLDQGIVVIKPGNEAPNGPLCSERGAMAQSSYIAQHLYEIASHFDISLAVWDTCTATASQCLRELATSRFSDLKDNQRISVSHGNGVMARMGHPTLPQIGLVQNWLRDEVRASLLDNPTCHLALVLHQTVAMKSGGKDSNGDRIEWPVFVGPDAGGRSSSEHWGKDFSTIHQIFMDGDKRKLLLNQLANKQGVPQSARTGFKDGSDQREVVVPKGFKGCVTLHQKLLDAQGIVPGDEGKYGYMSYTLYGVQSVGKTWWAMSLMGVPGMLPAILVAADGNSEYLRSCPSEIKDATFEPKVS